MAAHQAHNKRLGSQPEQALPVAPGDLLTRLRLLFHL
jgi:hypothetical protein